MKLEAVIEQQAGGRGNEITHMKLEAVIEQQAGEEGQ